MARKGAKRCSRKSTKTRRQRGGHVLKYLLPFMFIKANNMIAKKAKKTRKTKRKSKKK